MRQNVEDWFGELARLPGRAVVSNEHVPADMVFLGHTVKLLDLDDDSEQLVKLVGEATTPDANSDVLPVSARAPEGTRRSVSSCSMRWI